MRAQRLVTAIAATTLAVASLACEGRTSGMLDLRPDGQRARQAAQRTDVLAGTRPRVTGRCPAGVGFGNASPYVSLSTGSHRLQARSSSTGTTLVDFTRDLNTEGSFSLVPAPGFRSSVPCSSRTIRAPVSGQGKLRVVHVAAAPGTISVYVTSWNERPLVRDACRSDARLRRGVAVRHHRAGHVPRARDAGREPEHGPAGYGQPDRGQRDVCAPCS